MKRAQILWLQCWIALSGAVFWSIPPSLHHWKYVAAMSGCWALVCFTAIWVESLESWGHRFSAFCGFLLGTVEGLLGLLGLTERGGWMLAIAFLHACTFILSVMGRYVERTRSRKRPSLDYLAQQAIEEAAATKDATS